MPDASTRRDGWTSRSPGDAGIGAAFVGSSLAAAMATLAVGTRAPTAFAPDALAGTPIAIDSREEDCATAGGCHARDGAPAGATVVPEFVAVAVLTAGLCANQTTAPHRRTTMSAPPITSVNSRL